MKVNKLKNVMVMVCLLFPGVMGVILGELEPNMPLGIWFYFCLLPGVVLALFVAKYVS